MTNLTKDFFIKACIRAVRTMAQVALGMITVGMPMGEIDWKNVVSVALVAGIYSVLMAIATGIPEDKIDGEIVIDDNYEDVTKWLLNVKSNPDDIPNMDSVRLKVVNKKEQK